MWYSICLLLILDPWFSIKHAGKQIYFSKKLKSKTNSVPQFFCRDLVVAGDVNITFYHRNNKKVMFHFAFNTSFEDIEASSIDFARREMEKACSDTKRFSPLFKVKLFMMNMKELKATRQIQSAIKKDGSNSSLSSSEFNDIGTCSVCNELILEEESSLAVTFLF